MYYPITAHTKLFDAFAVVPPGLKAGAPGTSARSAEKFQAFLSPGFRPAPFEHHAFIPGLKAGDFPRRGFIKAVKRFTAWPVRYPQHGKRFGFLISFLVFSLSSFVFQAPLLADLKNQSAEEYRLRGYDEQQKGNFDRALTYYSKAISLGLNNAVVYNDIGVVYEELGIQDKAELHYLKAIECDSNYLPPYTNLAFLYKTLGVQDKAAYYFKERLERSEPNDPWREKIRNELIQADPEYEARKVRENARELTDQLIHKAHQEFTLQIERAEKHYQKGKQLLHDMEYDGAVSEFESALALTPDNPKILKARDLAVYERKIEEIKKEVKFAVENLEAGDLEAARKEFQKILTLMPSGQIQSPEK